MGEQAAARPGSVEHWARVKPDAVAAVEGDRRLSWKALDEKADRLAEALAQGGVARGDAVAVRTQIRLEWLVVAAALAKLGCPLVGVNWRLTPDELDHVLEASRARAFVCDDADPSALAPVLDIRGIALRISLDAPAPGFTTYAEATSALAPPRVSATDAPLVIFTSGTTGRPRGVVSGLKPDDPAAAQAAAEYAADVTGSVPRSASDAILVTMPFSHAAAPAQVRRGIATGGLVVLLRRFEAEAMLALTAEHRVGAWVVVPTMLNRIAALPPEVFARYDLSSLKSIQVGAAPVYASTKTWVAECFGELLHESYGSTESGMMTHLSPAMHREKPGSCGKPFRHVEIAVRDDAGRDLPVGATGEIWVRTPVTINRYLGGEPLGPDVRDARGLFRTGDVGRLDADGFLYITDRAKDMIVSGGVNIYPAEIEAALHGHPAIRDVAVIGVPDAEYGEQAKAFVELNPGMSADAADILAHGRKSLAGYKLPKSVEVVDELPRNLMGKVLKRDLRAGYWAGRERNV